MIKILVIDDRKDNLISVTALLKNLEPEYEILTALSGNEGIQLAQSEQPDTILLDIQMPKMDGYEVCRRLRAEQKTKRVPIIFLTATKTTPEDRIKGLEMGGDTYLTKPIDAGELMANLHAMLRIKKGEDELEYEKDLLEEKVIERTKKLKELSDKYFDLYENAPDMFASVDSKTAIIHRCNRTLAENLDYTKDEIIGQPIFFVYHPDCIEIAKKYFQQFADTRVIRDAEMQLKRKDGSKIDVSLNVSAVRDEKGNILSSRSVWRDVSELKRAERKLQEYANHLENMVAIRTAGLETANKELESFAYSVSHDLKAPLRSIEGWSTILQEEYGAQLDVQANQYLDRVRSEVQRMDTLIKDLLALSHVGLLEMRQHLVNLTTVGETIAARLQELEPERQVEFSIQPNLMAKADHHLIEIALTNLLGNAWKFTGPRTPARIEFGKINHKGKPTYFVRDNGVGFDMEYSQNLFGAFQRLHKESEFSGTGIGLTIVQRIIHRHGGRVWVEAELDKGATIFFTLS